MDHGTATGAAGLQSAGGGCDSTQDRGSHHLTFKIFVDPESLRMIMAFLLVMLVEGEQVAGRFHFRNIHRCNQFAFWLEQGSIKPIEGRRLNNQENITAYCIPVKVPPNTPFYD